MSRRASWGMASNISSMSVSSPREDTEIIKRNCTNATKIPSAPNTTRRERTEEKEGRRRHDHDDSSFTTMLVENLFMHTPGVSRRGIRNALFYLIVDHVRSYYTSYNHDTTSWKEFFRVRLSTLKRTPSSNIRKETGPSCSYKDLCKRVPSATRLLRPT